MTAPKLPVSSVVNVKVEMSPIAAALRNFGACLVIGSSDVVDVGERIREYSDIGTVAEDFGTDAPEYVAAQAFFAQSPKPSILYIGRWAKEATAGLAKGRILSTEEKKIEKFKSISSGSFDITVDGSKVSVSAVNLSTQSNLNGVASSVTAGLNSKATCVWDGLRFVVKSKTTGKTSSVTVATSTELSSALGLSEGVTTVGGADSEKLVDCVATMLDYTTWYGAIIACEYSTDDAEQVAGIIEAASPSRIVGFTTNDTMETDSTQEDSLGAKLHALGYNRTMVMYSSVHKQAVASVMGRMSTVNFEGSNTCITLKFKQAPGVVAENLRTSQATALKKHCVNVFAAYQNDTSILQEGVMAGGYFIDEVHGLDWLQNRIETDVWNLLYGLKKVGQDETGADNLVATVTKGLEQGVRNGLIAPGLWNGDSFGALKTGDTLASGYYVYIQPMDQQAQSDREARKAPPIQIAVKLKGAVHFVDVTITVNR